MVSELLIYLDTLYVSTRGDDLGRVSVIDIFPAGLEYRALRAKFWNDLLSAAMPL